MAATLGPRYRPDAPAASAGCAIEIDCARRNARDEVTHLGGPGTDGRRWLGELASIVAAAERGDVRYFVTRGGQQLGLCVKAGELVTMVEDGWSVRRLPTCDRADGRSSPKT